MDKRRERSRRERAQWAARKSRWEALTETGSEATEDDVRRYESWFDADGGPWFTGEWEPAERRGE